MHTNWVVLRLFLTTTVKNYQTDRPGKKMYGEGKVARKVCHGDELTEVSTGHLWEVTGHSLKGGLPHFTLSCKHPGRTDTDVVLCESGLLMRFNRTAKSSQPVFSFGRLTRLVRPLF